MSDRILVEQRRFDLRARLRSFRYAASGIGFMMRSQHNAWIHLAATTFVCGLGFWLRVTAADWRWLIVAMLLVWVAEAINTSFEHLCDVVSPELHASVQKSKDIAAGAVLICAIGATILGLLTFRPYLG
jgi:diacylglycerol kinase (ATP)